VGRPGLLISRVHIGGVTLPDNTVWYKLSTLSEGNALNPSDVLSLQHAVAAFVSQRSGAVVFVQGMEYLEAYLDFTIIVKVLHFWSDQVAKNSASLVVSIVPGAWEQAQLARPQERAETAKGFIARRGGQFLYWFVSGLSV
jgi:hypothetical protein